MLEEPALERLDARSGRGRELVRRDDPRVVDVEGRRLAQEVDLVQGDDLR